MLTFFGCPLFSEPFPARQVLQTMSYAGVSNRMSAVVSTLCLDVHFLPAQICHTFAFSLNLFAAKKAFTSEPHQRLTDAAKQRVHNTSRIRLR